MFGSGVCVCSCVLGVVFVCVWGVYIYMVCLVCVGI